MHVCMYSFGYFFTSIKMLHLSDVIYYNPLQHELPIFHRFLRYKPRQVSIADQLIDAVLIDNFHSVISSYFEI